MRPLLVARPDVRRRMRLMLELALIYGAAPLVIRYAIFALKVPLFAILQPILLGFVVYLLWDPTFKVKAELARGITLRQAGLILLVFACAAPAIAVATAAVYPELFLGMPSSKPGLWLFVMVLYPLLSVTPQELVYRTFYFHRYGPLFEGARGLAIAVNGIAFGFGHIIFGNWIAVLGTVVVGCLLAWRYERTRSFWAVWLEHTLYGCLVFTVGLGQFFFSGVLLGR